MVALDSNQSTFDCSRSYLHGFPVQLLEVALGCWLARMLVLDLSAAAQFWTVCFEFAHLLHPFQKHLDEL